MFVEIVKKRSFYAGTNHKFILLLGGTNFKLVLISVTWHWPPNSNVTDRIHSLTATSCLFVVILAHFGPGHTHPVNPTCEFGNFWIRSPEWKLLNPKFFRIRADGRIRIPSNPMTFKIGSSLYSRLDRVTTKIMASNQNVLAVLVGLISSLVACVQLNVAMSTVHLNYVKQRFDIPRVLLVSDGRIARHKHLKRAGRQPRPLKFYILTYSIHMFSRSSTSSSVQKKQSDLLLSFFVCSAFAVACCKQ